MVAYNRLRIQDAGFAAGSSLLAKSQLLQQAASSILARENSSPQQVQSLLN